MTGCYNFVIKDAWEDGMCCSQGDGSYALYVNGTFVKSGGEFGSSENVTIGGNCQSSMPSSMPSLMSITSYTNTTLFPPTATRHPRPSSKPNQSPSPIQEEEPPPSLTTTLTPAQMSLPSFSPTTSFSELNSTELI
eukprot:CAMPEP_0183780738 /NCGR_PEP_ID=MMETSP0739-20130205/57052_1 /TAXON_ID=385413 /ORGANISM="Thalassiosira miniscula, Strain CCMP1093" /LENGTH=135 /DNA_ID=CAMNT_0026023769 /DNA_START=15 /DNA_END=422 /DNA_ORIENTATION=-